MKTLRLEGLLLVCAGCSLALSTDEYREPLGDAGSDSPTFDGCTPIPETCNGVSDDCDGNVDEDTCDFPNTSASCEPGGCEVVSCDIGFLDCSEGMGCETAEDRNNCGDCEMVCGATEQCESGICVEPTLDWSWTIDEVGNDSLIYISSGLSQRYLLTFPSSGAPVDFFPSTGTPFTVEEPGQPIALLVAMNDSGQERWRVRLTATRLRTVAAKSIAGVDGVFIAGDFQGQLEADGPSNTVTLNSSKTRRDGFVLRVDGSGNIQRIAQPTDRGEADESQNIRDIAVATDGTIYVLGASTGDLAVVRNGRSFLDDVPTGRYGFLLRVKGFGGAATPLPGFWESVTTDSEANAYIGTRLEEDVTLGGTTYSDNRFAPLVASYSPELALRWVQAPLAPGDTQGEEDPLYLHVGNGNLYLSHALNNAHTFGGQALEGGGFVAELSLTDGMVQWARNLGMTTPAISTDGERLYFAGAGTGTINLGGGTLGPAVDRDALVGVLQSTGEYEVARLFGGLDRDVGIRVQPTSSGFMVAGYWRGTMTVDAEMFVSVDPQDLFVFHFSTED